MPGLLALLLDPCQSSPILKGPKDMFLPHEEFSSFSVNILQNCIFLHFYLYPITYRLSCQTPIRTKQKFILDIICIPYLYFHWYNTYFCISDKSQLFMSMASLSLLATPPSKIQVFQYSLASRIRISVFIFLSFWPSKTVHQFLPAICRYEVSFWVKCTLAIYQSAWNISNVLTVSRPQEVWNSRICICILVSILYFYIVFLMSWPSLVLRRCGILQISFHPLVHIFLTCDPVLKQTHHYIVIGILKSLTRMYPRAPIIGECF